MTADTYDRSTRPAGVERTDWREVHDAIQAVLQQLDDAVGKGAPGAEVRAGSNSATGWHLFSYRVYSTTAGETDPVVVGITIGPAKQGVALRADIAGENLGDVLFELPPRDAADKPGVIGAARELATKLSERADVIISALADANRHV